MKRITLFLLLLATLIAGCNKNELTIQSNESASVSSQPFINLSEVKNELLLPFAKVMNAQDSAAHFQDRFKQRYGHFLWNNAVIKNIGRDVVSIIPLTISNRDVQGFVIARLQSGKASFNLYSKWNRFSFGYKETADKMNNLQITTLFDYFNYFIYGIDKRPLYDVRELPTLKGIADTANLAGFYAKVKFPKSAGLYLCVTTTEEVDWYYDPDGEDDPCDCSGNEVYAYTTYRSSTTCTTTGGGGGGSTGDGTGGGGDSEGGSGGTGGGGTNPDTEDNWYVPPGEQVLFGSDWGLYKTDENNYTSLLSAKDDAIFEANSAWQPFKVENLRTLGINRGWGTGIELNRKCGKAFEETALKYFNLTPNGKDFQSPTRVTRYAPGNPQKVRPDAVDGIMYIHSDNNSQDIVQLPGWFITEVKAIESEVSTSTNLYQIEAEIDLLARNRDQTLNNPTITYPIKVSPILFLVTTDNNAISQTVIDYAKQKGVWVWWSTSKYLALPNGSPSVSFTWPKWVEGGTYGKFGAKVPNNFMESVIKNFYIAPPTEVETSPGPNFTTDEESIEP